jgi:hypothetical protein
LGINIASLVDVGVFFALLVDVGVFFALLVDVGVFFASLVAVGGFPSQEGKHMLQRAERCCLFLSPQKHQGPASFFCREAEVLFGALKRKSCLSVASSFSLAEKSTGVGKKMQTANFLFVSFFFCSGKRKMKSIH